MQHYQLEILRLLYVGYATNICGYYASIFQLLGDRLKQLKTIKKKFEVVSVSTASVEEYQNKVLAEMSFLKQRGRDNFDSLSILSKNCGKELNKILGQK